MRARDFAPVLSLVLVGCGGSGCSGGSTGGSSSGGGGSSSSGGGSTSAAADYEVHEWGLLRAQRDGTTEVLRAGAIAPPRPIEPMAVDKPVLYFHAGSPLTLRSVGVHVEGGAILETWPFVAGRTDVAWTDVALGSPTNCTPSALPSGAEPPCAALGPGAYCESPSLALVRTSEASCVTTHGATERFLFYRAQSTTFTPPLRFTRTEVYEDVRVDNDGDAPIPGVLVRIWSDGTHTRTLVAQPPPPHGSVVIGHGFDALDDDQQPADAPYDRRGSLDESLPAPTVSGPGRAGIRQTMTEIGLSGGGRRVLQRLGRDALQRHGRQRGGRRRRPGRRAQRRWRSRAARVDRVLPARGRDERCGHAELRSAAAHRASRARDLDGDPRERRRALSRADQPSVPAR
ncbi:MAG: hypothetical protein U0353_01680 [Sandaracinus sp.]